MRVKGLFITMIYYHGSRWKATSNQLLFNVLSATLTVYEYQ
jgi:hypothetical protein